MSSPAEVREVLLAAFDDIDEVSATGDRGALIATYTVVIGPPGLTWSTQNVEPDEARFSIFLVVPAGEREADALLALYPVVVAAVEGARFDDGEPVGAVVRAAEPGSYLSGQTPLPCYNFRVEVAL